ncbi:MAG: PEP-CTERM sorting domain-containing protein [Luteolibacter sp.]
MKTNTPFFRLPSIAAILSLAGFQAANATVTLTIVEFTTTKFTVSVSGTLDINADTPSGPSPSNPAFFTSPSLFAIILNNSASTPFYTGLPTQLSNTLSTYFPNPTNAGMFDASSGRYGLTFSYDQTFPQSAGSVFAGSATFTGNFNPAAANPGDFQLWSGYDYAAPTPTFAVFHVNAVPEPSTTAGLILAVSVCCAIRRRPCR